MNGEITWTSSGKEFNSSIEWMWDADEPMDNFGLGMEFCLTINLINRFQNQGSNVFMFGLDNCKLPFYFACYADLVPGKKRVESVHKTEKIMEKIGLELGFVFWLFLLIFYFYYAVAKKEIVEKPCYYDDVPKLDLKIPGLEPSMILKLQELVVKYSLQDGRYAPKMGGFLYYFG